MTRRLSIALTLALGSVAAAQPAPSAKTPAAPAPAQVAAPAPPVDDFQHDLDELFGHGGITADQAASRAAGASPSVRRKVAEVEAAIASAEAAELARVPQIGAKASYTRLSYVAPVSFMFPGSDQAFTISQFQNAFLLEGSINVPLSDYLLRYPKLVDAAHRAEDVARYSKRSSEIDAGQDARLAYYEWLRSKLQVLIAKRQVAQVQGTVTQFKALFDAQRLSKADFLRVQSQEAQAEQTLDQLTNLAVLREEQLRLIIGATDNEPLSVGEDIRAEVTAPEAGALDHLMGIAKSQRFDFRVLDAGIDAKDKQRQAEKASQYPKLSAFALADYADPNQRVFPQEDKFKFTWSAGAQVSWTLNDTLVERTTDARLRAETNELRADRDNLERGTRIEVLAAQQDVTIAQHALATSKKGLDAAEESYRVRRELLAADRATAVELVDSETDLTRARISALDARVDLRVAMAKLAHALGNDTK